MTRQSEELQTHRAETSPHAPASGWSGVFSVAFAAIAPIVYFICVGINLSPFAYYPQVGEFHIQTQPDNAGPAMYWYGWIAYAIISGAIGGIFSILLPERVKRTLIRSMAWLAWVFPALALFAILYFLRQYFI